MSEKLTTQFLTEADIRDVSEGYATREYELGSPLAVISEVLQDAIWLMAFFRYDGESIPDSVHWLVPPFGQSKRAAAIHDWLFRHGGYWARNGEFIPVTRAQADAVYREFAIAKGTPKWRAAMRYGVLRGLGWSAWNKNRRYDHEWRNLAGKLSVRLLDGPRRGQPWLKFVNPEEVVS